MFAVVCPLCLCASVPCSGARVRPVSHTQSPELLSKGVAEPRACRLKEISCCCGSRAADPKPHQLRGFACRLCDPCMGRLSAAVG
jgi:hypothetical protein